MNKSNMPEDCLQTQCL